MLVETADRSFEFRRELRRAVELVGLPPLFRQGFADVGPQVAIRRLVAGHRIVSHRHARNLDDPRFDGVDQREVGNHPRKQRPFGVTRSLQEERRGRQVVDGLHADLLFDCFESGDPDAGFLIPFLGFFPVITDERLVLFQIGRFAAVAVMCLVIQDDDPALVAQLAADAIDHLSGRLGEGTVAVRPENRTRGLVDGLLFAKLEGVVVREHELRLLKLVQLMRGDNIQTAVVVVRIVRQQHAQPVANRDPRRDDQKRVRIPGILRVGQFVQRLPRDEHRHHDRLAAARGHLQGDAVQQRVRGLVELFRSFSIQTSPAFLATSKT